MNARIHTAESSDESTVIGEHTFDPERANAYNRDESSVMNRQLLVDFCADNSLRIANTWFRKRQEKLIDGGPPFTRGRYETLD